MDGAEARITITDVVLKERIPKSYRIKEVDIPLRKKRTRREVKILKRLQEHNFPAPKLIENDDFNITMTFIDGKRVMDVINPEMCLEIGKKLKLLHSLGIAHGDVTTANMIYTDEVYFIDFGLSLFSERTEDRAVDLHLLRHALESKHSDMWEDCFENVLKGYGMDVEMTQRLELVESRGRYK